MFVWDMEDKVHRARDIEDFNGGRKWMEETLITDEFGNGNNEFLCCAGGYYAPSAQAIIHADSIEEAEKQRDEYYKARIMAKNIIFEPLYAIVS